MTELPLKHTHILVGHYSTRKSKPAMATQLMFRPVGERRLRLMPSLETPLIVYTIPTIFILAAGFVELLFKVEHLKGTYGLVQMLRIVVVAHVFRFLQSILGENKVTPIYYLRNVLPFHDLPITACIAAFYTAIRILPRSQHLVPILVLCLLLFILILKTKGRELERDISPTQAPSNHSFLSITYFSRLETKDTIHTVDIEVIDHFAIILLTGICVDLVVHVENLRGTYESIYMVLVLAGRHSFYIIQFLRGPNKVLPLYYQRKVLLLYDIPFTATFAGFYIIFQTFSDTLVSLLILEISHLYQIHKSISERENLSIIQGTEPEQDMRPTQASSSNTEEFPPQQNHNNAISSSQNLSQREICDPPIGDGGSPSVHVASNGVRDLSAVNKESAGSIPILISKITDFSTWESRTFIGEGAFGNVSVFDDKKTGRSCAVKQLKDNYESKKREAILKEIDIFSKLEHRNIVKYYRQQEIDGRISICMEYIKRGSLKKYISNRKKEKEGIKILEEGVLDEPQIQKFTAQILSGLVYLNGKRVVHRDLKPENILVDDDDILKLVDFGLAKVLTASVGRHSELGTPYYAAPEVLENMGYESSRDAFAADIWSLGCVIIEMLSGKHPWPDLEPQQAFCEVFMKKNRPPIPEELRSSEGRKFLELCFERNPAKRLSAKELLDDPFVIEYTRRKEESTSSLRS